VAANSANWSPVIFDLARVLGLLVMKGATLHSVWLLPNLSTFCDFTLDRAKRANYIRNMVKIYNMHDAKSNLSKLIEEVLAGESVTIARAGQPLVDLTPHVATKFQLGFMAPLVGHVMTHEEEVEFFKPWDPADWAEEALPW
jgi:prevent-host-death family protein